MDERDFSSPKTSQFALRTVFTDIIADVHSFRVFGSISFSLGSSCQSQISNVNSLHFTPKSPERHHSRYR